MLNEKRTYFVFRNGRHPNELELGGLILSIPNPEKVSRFLPRWSTGEVSTLKADQKMIELPEKKSKWKFPASTREGSIRISLAELAHGSYRGSTKLELDVEGKGILRWLPEPEDILNEDILSSQNAERSERAKKFLKQHLSVIRHFWQLNRPRPEIWMITGLHSISDGKSTAGAEFHTDGRARMEVPPPEGGAATVAALTGKGALVGLKGDGSKTLPSKITTEWDGERIWAMEARRLKVDYFPKKADENAMLARRIELEEVLDLSRMAYHSRTAPRTKLDTGDVHPDSVDDGPETSKTPLYPVATIFALEPLIDEEQGRTRETAGMLTEEMTEEDWQYYNECLEELEPPEGDWGSESM